MVNPTMRRRPFAQPAEAVEPPQQGDAFPAESEKARPGCDACGGTGSRSGVVRTPDGGVRTAEWDCRDCPTHDPAATAHGLLRTVGGGYGC